MKNVSKQVAYLEGLMNGIDYDESSKEGKIFNAILNVLEEIDLSLEVLHDNYEELGDEVDAIDEDLSSLEDAFAEECDCNCGCCDDDIDEDDVACYELECPKCGETVYFDEDFFDSDEDAVICPACGEHIEIELDDDEDVQDDE